MPTEATQPTILGLSAYYHDSAAALLVNGRIIAAAQEERFTRKKHDAGFPRQALEYCLREANLSLDDVSSVVFYDKPLVKFERLLETYLTHAPRGFGSFAAAMPVWLKEKLFLKTTLRQELANVLGEHGKPLPQLLFAEHHESHAASAFYPSPFERAAVLCLDGIGEWATTSAWLGSNRELKRLWEIRFPDSLGLLYSAFTYFTGFKVNSEENKLMALAPYGEPRYADVIRNYLVDVKADGSFHLDMRYFDYCTGLTMTSSHFDNLFDGPRRKQGSELTQREMDIAASIQKVTEDIVLKLALSLHRETGEDNLCLAGGIALNCVGNGRLLRESPFKDIWVQPAAGDAGAALGCAQVAWYADDTHRRTVDRSDSMSGSYLGPCFSNDQIQRELSGMSASYTHLDDEPLMQTVAGLLEAGNVVGWFQGRMEFGPRALGGRSILGDPRNPKMRETMNLKINNRQSFSPFSPSVLAERVSDYFQLKSKSPYMLIAAPLDAQQRIPTSKKHDRLFGIEKLNVARSSLPAITHVDYSAEVQTVHKNTNPRYHALLKAFEARSGCGVLINTSFNVPGEPIVATPKDAYRCFMLTQMDYLVVENHLLSKADQQPWDKLHGLTERVRARVKDTVNRELDPKALRDFGLQFAAFFSVIFGLLLPWAANLNYPLWTWVVGLAMTAWALTAPETLRVLHTGWMRLAVPLNRITSPILMGLTYFAVFTPVAACRKLLRRYLPDKSEETNTTTYRIDAGENDIRAKLENPY